MKKSGYTDTKAATIMQQVSAGLPLTRACCEHNISVATYYQWRRKLRARAIEVPPPIEPIDHDSLQRLNQQHATHRCKAESNPQTLKES